MPVMKKVNKPEPKIKGKRGRPAGSTTKTPTHQFVAKDGCKLETVIRNVTARCLHGFDMEYKKTVLK
jgi:hypothetical protein